MKVEAVTKNSEDLEPIAKEAIWGGIREYLSKKTSQTDAYADVYHIAYAHTMGVLALAMQETQDLKSTGRVIKIVNSAMANAINDWYRLDDKKQTTRH